MQTVAHNLASRVVNKWEVGNMKLHNRIFFKLYILGPHKHSGLIF